MIKLKQLQHLNVLIPMPSTECENKLMTYSGASQGNKVFAMLVLGQHYFHSLLQQSAKLREKTKSQHSIINQFSLDMALFFPLQ